MRNEMSHNFTEDVIIDEFHVYGSAQVAFLDPDKPEDSLQVRFGSLKGNIHAWAYSIEVRFGSLKGNIHAWAFSIQVKIWFS